MSGPYSEPVTTGLEQGKLMTQQKYEVSRCNKHHAWKLIQGMYIISCTDRDTGEPIRLHLKVE